MWCTSAHLRGSLITLQSVSKGPMRKVEIPNNHFSRSIKKEIHFDGERKLDHKLTRN